MAGQQRYLVEDEASKTTWRGSCHEAWTHSCQMIWKHQAAQVLLHCKIRTRVIEPSHLEPRSFDNLPDVASATAWSTSANSLLCWASWARVQRATRRTESVTSRMRQTCCSSVCVTRKTAAKSCRNIELGRACSKGGPCHSAAGSAGLAVREACGQAVRSLTTKSGSKQTASS